ncbi:TCP-1/cpn60 chaperonin family protein [Actinidia rufa]|uniref:TCP-1/cpn60 chaperonin family protein n=1 Tax=Actinidia rufa TaxID=165716 RepID=A0A7J0EF47_9ERIC|nr:TCP-1/cpn60 chaperonin family protein [Actinidia rufa]
MPEARERGGATGNIVALKKKTKLDEGSAFDALQTFSRFVIAESKMVNIPLIVNGLLEGTIGAATAMIFIINFLDICGLLCSVMRYMLLLSLIEYKTLVMHGARSESTWKQLRELAMSTGMLFFSTLLNNATSACVALHRLDDVYAAASGWQKIINVRDLVNVLEDAIRGGYLILIIGDDVEKEGLATLVVNKLRGALKIAAIKAPRFRARKSEYLDDIAILRTAIRDEVGLSLDKTEKEVLGHAAKVVLTKDTTTLVSDGSTQESVNKRVAQIRNLLEAAEQVYEKEKLKERIAQLLGGLSVGSQMETELKEMKLRVEHALNATEAAVEEGIVVGGGCTLLRLVSKVASIKDTLENISMLLTLILLIVQTADEGSAFDALQNFGRFVIDDASNNNRRW